MQNLSCVVAVITFRSDADMVWGLGQIPVLISLVVVALIMFFHFKKSTADSQRALFKGFGVFVTCVSLIQLLYVIQILWTRSDLGGDFLVRYIRIGGTGFEYIMFLGFLLGFSFLLQPLEMYLMEKPKTPITKIDIIGFILLLIPYLGAILYSHPPMDEYWTLLAYPGVAIGGLGVLLSLIGSFWFYVRLGLKSTGILRQKGFLIGFGILAMYIGILAGQLLGDLGEWFLVAEPILICVGAWMCIRGLQIQL